MDTDSVSSCVAVVGEKNGHWLWNLCHVKKQALSNWIKPMFTSVSVQNCLHIIILSRCCNESGCHISSLLWTFMTVRMDETANPGLLQNDFRVLFNLLASLESCWVQHFSYMLWFDIYWNDSWCNFSPIENVFEASQLCNCSQAQFSFLSAVPGLCFSPLLSDPSQGRRSVEHWNTLKLWFGFLLFIPSCSCPLSSLSDIFKIVHVWAVLCFWRANGSGVSNQKIAKSFLQGLKERFNTYSHCTDVLQTFAFSN